MPQFKRVKIKKVRKYSERNRDPIPHSDGKRCFLCTRGIYHAMNGKGRECPICSAGRLPEPKEQEYDYSSWREYLFANYDG